MKVEKLNRASYVVIKREIRMGHLKWTIGQVAKDAGVTRSWIYKYHGKNKEEILINALRNTLKAFFLLSDEQMEILKAEGLPAAFMKSREIAVEFPEVYVFYFMHHQKDNVYGAMIREIEKDYVAKMMKRQQLTNVFQGSLFRCITYGLTTALFLDQEQTEKIIRFLMSPDFRDWLTKVPNLFQETAPGRPPLGERPLDVQQ